MLVMDTAHYIRPAEVPIFPELERGQGYDLTPELGPVRPPDSQ